MRNLILSLLLVFAIDVHAQKQVRRATIAFYNVENLYDTIVSADYIDGTKNANNPAFHRSIPRDSISLLEHQNYKGQFSDALLKGKKVVRNQILADDFTPRGLHPNTSKVYQQKIHNISKVVSDIGREFTHTAPVIVGMAEIENRQVLEDLVKTPALSPYNYGIVHYNSYDARGIDNALIYQKSRFTVEKFWKKELKIFNENGNREYTRDILVVLGKLDGEDFAFFVNHFPSRFGGEARSLPKRNAAATLLKQQMDSVRAMPEDYKLIAMGDFNDDPVNPSIAEHLGATGSEGKVGPKHPYFNPMVDMFKHGVASLAYQDAPNLFDQMIYSQNLIRKKDTDPSDYKVYVTRIFAPEYLKTKEGNFKGYPFRAWSGSAFTGGYSDHFPAYLILQRFVN